MHKSISLRLLLAAGGLIAAGIGSAILMAPDAFYGGYGIELGHNVNLINETKASGGSLLALGILIMTGAFVAELTFASTVVTAVLYLSYGLSRLLSMASDGMPEGGLVWAAVFELAVGAIGAFALFRTRKSASGKVYV